MEYRARAGSASITISCDVGASLDHSRTAISLEIGGLLSPESQVELHVDGEAISFPTDKSGGVTISRCADCADKFASLWQMLRTGNVLRVVAADGRTASFSLRGTARLMPKEPCLTGPERSASTLLDEGESSQSSKPLPQPAALIVPESCGRIEPATATVAALGGARRIAFVVGMGRYTGGIPRLANPINDARRVATALLGLGFTVYYSTDTTGTAVLACAGRARAEAGDPEVVLFYYAGHGIQIEDENYLIATNADLADGPNRGFLPVAAVAQALRAPASAFVVILDACRNNPFLQDGPSGLSPSTGRGLTVTKGEAEMTARQTQARGVFVAYSTSPNAVALDGDGEMSPFAEAFVRHLTTPGHSLQRVMSAVANSVGEATDWQQTPWTRSSLTGELKLAGTMTIEEVQAASENWARRSRELLDSGRRHDALAAALKGIPPGTTDDHALADYPLAYRALTDAWLSGNARIPADLAAIPGRVLHGSWFSPDRRTYAVAYYNDGYFVDLDLVRVADATRIAKLIDRHDTPEFLTSVAFSGDGRVIAADVFGEYRVWRTGDGALVSRFPQERLGTGELALSPLGTRLLTKAGNQFTVVDAATGRRLARSTLDELKRDDARLAAFLRGHRHSTLKISFADENRLCVGASGESSNQSALPVAFGIYDIASDSFELAGTLDADRAWISYGTYCSRDGRWFAIAAADEAAPSRLWLWDRRSGAVRMRLPEGSESATSAFDAAARYLLVDMATHLVLYDTSTLSFAFERIGDESAANPGLFRPDGQRWDTRRETLPAVAHVLSVGRNLLAAVERELGPAGVAALADDRVSLWRAY
ncbi:MAG: hypothetical protein BroJett030_09200 [Alphaproteobacteria bacterium]|nr:MAG: hypothetical protein BroJett030_09200 [Alphaproteobacteria bacterium]